MKIVAPNISHVIPFFSFSGKTMGENPRRKGLWTCLQTDACRRLAAFKTLEAFKEAGATPSIFLCAITNELNETTSTGGRYGYGTIFKLAQ